MSLLISTSERTSSASSSNLRNAAKPIKQITTERILYKEAIASALQANNCSGWETVIGSVLDVRWASKRCAPERKFFTNGWSVGLERALHPTDSGNGVNGRLYRRHCLRLRHQMTQINSKLKQRCGKSCQAMITRPRLPSVVGRGILEWRTGSSASQSHI